MKTWMENKGKFRLTQIVLSALQIIGFFLFPYALLNTGLAGALMPGMDGLIGMASGLTGTPAKLTGLSMLTTIINPELEDLWVVGLFLTIAAVFALTQLLMHLFGKGKLSYILTIIFGIMQTGAYALALISTNILCTGELSLYKPGPAAWIMMPASIAAIAAAVAAMIIDRDSLAAGGKKAAKKSDGFLIGMNGTYAGARIPVRDGETLVIGRDPSVSSIVLSGSGTSRKHCTVSYDSKSKVYTVTDYSSNGVFDREGNRLQRGWKDIMRIGDEIRIANSADVFRFG